MIMNLLMHLQRKSRPLNVLILNLMPTKIVTETQILRKLSNTPVQIQVELLRTASCGQFSVNISKPGITKGQHWHHSKWEFFVVVSGRALIQQREIGSGKVLEFRVSGKNIQAVHMLPGYTHNIINLSQTEDLVTLMWANEPFDPRHPDTYFEEV